MRHRAAWGGETLANKKHFRIEEVAQSTGLTPRALRFYEEKGLLVPAQRTPGGHRLYTADEVASLLRIKELKQLLGFSLGEIRDLVASEHPTARNTAAQRSALERVLAAVRDKRSRLARLEQALRRRMADLGRRS